MDFFEYRELHEAFDKPYKFSGKGLNKKEGNAKYTFTTEDDWGDEVEVFFESDKEEEPNYTISFDRDGSTNVTGEGDAMRIFATVIAIIEDFVKKRNPKLMGFTAFKDVFASATAPGKSSREKLYDRMLKRYAGTMGYKYYKVSGGNKTEFELRRKS